MRTPIQRDDAHVVNHLDFDRDIVFGLDDLIVVVVGGRNHGRSGSPPQDAADGQGEVFRPLGWASLNRGSRCVRFARPRR